jgi:hypothetical protein
MSIKDETQERRVAVRCDDHAGEMREKIAKRRVAAAPAPKVEQQVVDPIAELLEPKPAEKPKRPPKIYTIPEHHSVTTCKSCVAAIVFVTTESGSPMPVEPYGEHRGEPHWIHCPNANEHRRRA